MSDQPETFALGLTLREAARTASSNSKAPQTNQLAGTLSGRTNNQEQVQTLLEKMRKMKAFGEPKLGDSTQGRGQEVNFSINFNYDLPDVTQRTTNGTSSGATPKR